MKRIPSRVVALSLVAFVVVFAAARAADEPALPEGVRGFSGQVRGVVVAKGENNTFTFKVGRVIRVWEGNKAEHPEALVGQTVKVGPRWVQGEGGRWHPIELHVAFIRKLAPGQEHTLEIRNVERDHFSILELSAEQRALAAGKADDQPPQPAAEGDRQTQRLEAQVRELRAEVQRLKERLERLEKQLAELRALVKRSQEP